MRQRGRIMSEIRHNALLQTVSERKSNKDRDTCDITSPSVVEYNDYPSIEIYNIDDNTRNVESNDSVSSFFLRLRLCRFLRPLRLG